jgi:hypothetical protein
MWASWRAGELPLPASWPSAPDALLALLDRHGDDRTRLWLVASPGRVHGLAMVHWPEDAEDTVELATLLAHEERTDALEREVLRALLPFTAGLSPFVLADPEDPDQGSNLAAVGFRLVDPGPPERWELD